MVHRDGRETLLLAKEAAEDTGGEVLHAYVDSLFVRWDRLPAPAELRTLLDDISARTGLPIAPDGIYRWVVFLPSKVNSKRPVPNRYFGVFQKGEVKARGIAARRHDTPPWIAWVQMELIQILAGCPQPEAALLAAWQRVQCELADLRLARIPLEQLLLGQCISRELEDYRSPSPAARAAAQLKATGKLVKPGQRVRFLYTLGDPGVYAWNLPERPVPARVDVPRYRELLLRAAREVLDPFAPPESGPHELFQLPSSLDWLYDQAQHSHTSLESFSCLSPSF